MPPVLSNLKVILSCRMSRETRALNTPLSLLAERSLQPLPERPFPHTSVSAADRLLPRLHRPCAATPAVKTGGTREWKQEQSSKADKRLTPCLFSSCLSAINTLHTFPAACEDRLSPACFQAARDRLDSVTNSDGAGTPPCAALQGALPAERRSRSAPGLRQPHQRAPVTRAASPGPGGASSPLPPLLPPAAAVPARSATAWAARQQRGRWQAQGAQLGWKQSTSELLPSVGAVRITPSVHPTGQEQENSALLRANKKQHQPRSHLPPGTPTVTRRHRRTERRRFAQTRLAGGVRYSAAQN